MPGPTQTLIVNKAVGLLGSSARVNSMTENTPTARLAMSFWDLARDEVLADHPWNFAVFRTDLAASADHVPACEYEYAYELPADFLRWLPWQRDHANWFAGEQEGQFIVSNAEAPIYIRYIARIEDAALWSPGFVDALSAKLAFYMARGVTGRSSMIDKMGQFYDAALSAARRQDGLATNRQRHASNRSSWLDARSRYGIPPR